MRDGISTPFGIVEKDCPRMMDTNFDEELLRSLDERDAIFTISMTGNFAHLSIDSIKSRSCYTALFTTAHNKDFEDAFSDVYYLTKEDHSDEKSVRGKFGVLYLFDLLYNLYLKTYGDN